MSRRVLLSGFLLLFGISIGVILTRIWSQGLASDALTAISLFIAGIGSGAVLLMAGWAIAAGRRADSETQFGTRPTADESQDRRVELSAECRALTPDRARPEGAPDSLHWARQIADKKVAVTFSLAWFYRLRFPFMLRPVAIGSQASVTPAAFGTGPAVALTLPGWLASSPSSSFKIVRIPRSGLLLASLGLGALAQVSISAGEQDLGLLIYGLAISVCLAWALTKRTLLVDVVDFADLSPRFETVLILCVFLVAFAMRFYSLNTTPVGIDGDEIKWTEQAAFTQVWHENRGPFLGFPIYDPVSFVLAQISFSIWGMSFLAPRLMVALLSLIATLAFYFLVRRSFNATVALVAAFLMAVSFYDLGASRQAVVESYTKLPVILAFLFVVKAIDTRSLLYFILTGIVLLLGILTYDTFYVVPVAVITYIVIRAIADWRSWRKWTVSLAATLVPMLPAASRVGSVISGRQIDYLKAVGSGGHAGSALLAELPNLFGRLGDVFTPLFVEARWHDYVMNWPGPLINPIILPLFVLGLIMIVMAARQGHNLLMLLWFAIAFFPAPLLSGMTVPRVLYASLPAILICSAVGIVVAASALVSLSRQKTNRMIAIGLASLLVLIGIRDATIYFSEFTTSQDAAERRQFIDDFSSSLQIAPMTILPVDQRVEDFVWASEELPLFISRGVYDLNTADQHYKVVTTDELLGQLHNIGGNYPQVNILFQQSLASRDPNRAAAQATVGRCYPNAAVKQGEYFSLYTLASADLQSPACYSLSNLKPVAPVAGQVFSAHDPVEFKWEAGSAAPQSFMLQIQRRDPNLTWIEAEDFSHDQGWFTEAKGEGYSGNGYLLDKLHAGKASYTLEIASGGAYTFWVRSFRRQMDDHRIFLSVAGQPREFALGGEESVNQWIWESVGIFNLNPGPVHLDLSRQYGNSGWTSILVDALLVSSDQNFDPRVDSLWNTSLNTGEVLSYANHYGLQEGLDAGSYRWQVKIFDGDKLIDSLGERGKSTDFAEFTIQ